MTAEASRPNLSPESLRGCYHSSREATREDLMRTRNGLAHALLLLPLAAAGQQAAPAAFPAQAKDPTIGYAGPRITAPEMVPANTAVPAPPQCDEVDGVVRLSAFVDADGQLRDVRALHSDDARLADLAIGVVEAQRYRAGTRDGAPVATAVELTAGLHACAQGGSGEGGREGSGLILRDRPFLAMRLSSPAPPAADAGSGTSGGAQAASGQDHSIHPAYRVGGSISAPVAIHEVEARYSAGARRRRITGTCVVGLVVDTDGMPRELHVIRALEPSLDERALDAVGQYRFRPALRDGRTPVPVEITVAVNFDLN